ncbi:monocarboxylate transporter 11-like [Ruditapes philippinarum]|uniref:monocarboxylate transporter 11-like n=1 Tax=Ruditapes philippinarum TaxID=129788 RepID=UPI00295BD04C|nr:monocarboxylate transporter 11-like [Ruditapes philippinarum]
MKDSTKWLFFGVAFVLSTLEFGLVFSFGALFSVIRDTFGTDRPTTASVQSVLMGVATCFSAVSGVLINKLGLHVVILLSSICVTLGFVTSFFVTKIWYLYFTISILAGIGMSQLYVISITLAATIQNKKQKLLGIAIHSTCVPVAGLIYPHLLDLLTSSYGLCGVIRDNTGSYNDAFTIISAAQGIASALFILDIIMRKLCRNSAEHDNNAV